MTDATARREAKIANEEGFCGFCFNRGKPVVHRRDCKLVREHGSRIALKVEPRETP